MALPEPTARVALVKVYLDPKYDEAQCSDYLAETFRELEESGMIDWHYIGQVEPTPWVDHYGPTPEQDLQATIHGEG